MLRRPLLLAIGWICVGLGALGAFLPLLPTTPFLLLAVWAFSQSSPEMANRIRNHRIAGPYIRDWQDAGVIPAKAKALSMSMMMAAFAYMYFGSNAPAWAVGVAGAILSAVAVYILTRPSQRPED